MKLFEAAQEGDISLIELSVNNGANIDDVSMGHGRMPLCPIHIACKFRQIDAVKKFIELGCRLDFTDTKIPNPISILASIRDTKFKNVRDIEILDTLIVHGCPLTPSTNTSRSMVTDAVVAKNYVLAKKMVEYGVEINDETFDWGLGTGNDELIHYFIGYGCDVNSKNNEGQTRLMRWGHNATVIEALLRNGADPNICDNYGFSILNSNVYYTELQQNYIEEYLEEIHSQ